MNQEPTEDNIIKSKEEQNSDLHGYGDDVLSIEEINEHILGRRAQGKSVKDVSDVYHTFRDYVDMRNHLVVALFNAYPEFSWKSKKHHDEENDPIFNDTFITGMDTPEGPISFHLKLKFWDDLNVPEIDRAPEYDGYTQKDVKMRLRSLNKKRGSK